MLAQHAAVVHLVDVIAGENQDVFGLLRTNRIDVLVDGIGGAHVPVLTHPLHRRQDFDELSHFAADDIPPFADVPVQRQRFVLGKNVDATQIRVDAVGKGNVDDAVDTAEGDCGLGSITG